jgi:hypothetical protein
MRRTVTIAAAIIATAGGLAVAAPAQAIPTTFRVTLAHNPTGAIYTAGTGHIRAWQECETASGQTDYYIYGPWAAKNVWSWTGNCGAVYRAHGADLA